MPRFEHVFQHGFVYFAKSHGYEPYNKQLNQESVIFEEDVAEWVDKRRGSDCLEVLKGGGEIVLDLGCHFDYSVKNLYFIRKMKLGKFLNEEIEI